jgi:hypothetical protein
MSRFFKETITDFLKHTPCSEGTHLFLQRLLDDSDRRIDRIWQDLVVKDMADNTDQRTAFVNGLSACWQFSESSNELAKIRHDVRKLQRKVAESSKEYMRQVTETARLMPSPDRARLLKQMRGVVNQVESKFRLDPVDYVLKTDKALKMSEEDYESFLQRIDIRSDHSGSRPHTAFMRLVSYWLYLRTKQWHDDSVADLATLAFPDYKGPQGEGFTVDTVISARRGMRFSRAQRRTKSS